jgi:hypothetical protein
MEQQWRPVQPGLRTFCTLMPVLFLVSAVLIGAVAAPLTDARGAVLWQEILCALGLFLLAGQLVGVRQLIVNGQVDPQVAVPRVKTVRRGALAVGGICLIPLAAVVLLNVPAVVPLMLTVFVVIAAFLTFSGLTELARS